MIISIILEVPLTETSSFKDQINDDPLANEKLHEANYKRKLIPFPEFQ